MFLAWTRRLTSLVVDAGRHLGGRARCLARSPGQEISKRLQTLLFPRAMVPNHDSPPLPPSFGGIVAARMSVVSGQQVAFFFRADEPAPLSSPTLTPRAHNRTLRHIVTGILREHPRAPGRHDRDAPDRAATPHSTSTPPAATPRSRNTIATQTAASTPDELSALDADWKKSVGARRWTFTAEYCGRRAAPTPGNTSPLH